jgi:hypothetical protein
MTHVIVKPFESFRNYFGTEQGPEGMITQKRAALAKLDKEIEDLTIDIGLLDPTNTTPVDYRHQDRLLRSKRQRLTERRQRLAEEIAGLESA